MSKNINIGNRKRLIDGKGIVEQLSLDLQNEFPAIFGFVPWRHHVEIVTKLGKEINNKTLYNIDTGHKSVLNDTKDWIVVDQNI